MEFINMLEAKSNLSRLVEAVETGKQSEIVIARNGRPAARLVAMSAQPPVGPRIGIARGQFTVPEDFNEGDEEIAALFNGSID